MRAVSPNNHVVDEGESATLAFLIARDSNGAVWSNDGTMFSFTNRSGVEYSLESSFQNSIPDFPQYFIYTIPSVRLSDAGIYTALVPSKYSV